MFYLILSKILSDDMQHAYYKLPNNRELLDTLCFLIFPEDKSIDYQLYLEVNYYKDIYLYIILYIIYKLKYSKKVDK
jgi:hypothetical protein